MKLSELVQLLQRALDQHGDMPVFRADPYYDNQPFTADDIEVIVHTDNRKAVIL